jgi:hypothetical protein
MLYKHNGRQSQGLRSTRLLADGTICLNSETGPQIPSEEAHHFIRFKKSYAVSLIRKKFKRQLKRSKFEADINLKKSNSVDQSSLKFVESKLEGQTFNHDSNVDLPCAAAGRYIMSIQLMEGKARTSKAHIVQFMEQHVWVRKLNLNL